MRGRNVDYSVLERILAGSEGPRHLPLEILTSITDNFSEDRKIGRGGFSDVYKGVLHDWTVAVKKITENSNNIEGADKLFYREVESLLKIIEHPNVVRFLGFYSNSHHEANERRVVEIRERLLCFEYISNGSLEKYITYDELRGLEWNVRYQIIEGICEGLKYLHNEKNIIHMDLKPANVMVDTDRVPKITDFGLARLVENKNTTGHRFCSQGYCAPEYIIAGTTTFKCDIYSLGVIIKELVTGQKEIPNKDHVIRRWRCRWRKSATYTRVQVQQITKCIEIAERCTQKQPEMRPWISDIIRDLDESGNTDANISAVNQIPYLDYDDMLGIEPLELRFTFELNKEKISNEVKLTNETDNCIAFNIMTVRPLQYLYCTWPNKGIVRPKSMIAVKITLRAQEVAQGRSMPHDDEFIVQSTKVEDGLTDEDITEDMFNEAGKVVDKVKLTVVYDDQSMILQADQSLLEPNAPVDEETKSREPCAKRQRLTFFGPQLQLVPTTNGNSKDRMPVTVSVMTGAMGMLLPKLLKLLKQEHNLQKSLKKCFEALERQLKRMQPGLYELPQAQQDQLDEEAKVWANELKELSYDAEDIVDDLIVRIEHSAPITDQDSIEEKVEDIRERVKEAAEWHAKYKLRHPPATSSSTEDPRLPALYKDHRELVGINGPRDELMSRLTSWPDEASCKRQLKIISIFGEGGLGKTTVAKQVYNRLAQKFDVTAFVPVGRKPDMKRLLKDILIQLDRKTSGEILSQPWDELQLIEKIQNVLKNKRYFIIIDDIWDIKSWETIKCAFIDNENGSRVMITSRIYDVAKSTGEACKLEPLSYDQSKQLFYSRLTRKGTCTFDQPDEQSTKYILEKCGGLPLAIITIASLLDGKRVEDWPKVYNCIKFGHEDNKAENTRKILLFSYFDLPCHLKTCLLYLSIYPEDHEIEKTKLVWKWIAEGFVRQEKGKRLFEVGEGYFNELINRSIIQPVEEPIRPYLPHQMPQTGTICGCRIHDMVHDLICSMAKEESFVSILDTDEQDLSCQNNARILGVHKRSLEQQDLANTRKQVMRSLSASTGCDLSRMGQDSLLPSFRVLRVLSLEYCSDDRGNDYHLKSIAQLCHLRYLGLFATLISELPMEIGDLKCLQLLDLTQTQIEALPQSVTLLRELKCLLCYSEEYPVKLPYGMGSLTSLELLHLNLERPVFYTDSLSDPYLADFLKELGKLTELRVLHIKTSWFSDSLNKALVESLNKLKRMEELVIIDSTAFKDLGGDYNYNDSWDDYSPCQLLRHLILRSAKMPVWMDVASLGNITYLNLRVTSFTQSDFGHLGSLPELRSLVLAFDYAFRGAVAAADSDAFPKLRYFETSCSLKLRYVQGAMRCLESLKLNVNVSPDVELDFDSIQCLHSLVKVSALFYNMMAKEVEVVKAALRHAVDNHPNRPILSFGPL